MFLPHCLTQIKLLLQNVSVPTHVKLNPCRWKWRAKKGLSYQAEAELKIDIIKSTIQANQIFTQRSWWAICKLQRRFQLFLIYVLKPRLSEAPIREKENCHRTAR